MTPTQAFVAAAQETQEVTDAAGRTLMFRRIGPLDRLRLFKAVGAEESYNERYLGLAGLAFAVVAIDGVPMPQPTNVTQIEGIIARLGNDGVRAIGDWLDAEEPAAATAGN
jgi:hypothetical protein